MEKQEIKQIPIKNYIILIVLFIGGIILTGYSCNWYKIYDEYQRETPVIRGTLSEITAEEIDHYVLDNPTTIFYMCTSKDFACRNYEKDLKKVIESQDLQNNIIYVNLSNVDINSFVDNFNKTYSYKKKLTVNYPALIVFEDGKVTSILQGSNNKKLTVSKTKQFIELNNIGNNYE
ncbi:MAG: hypothetical protein E7160_01165 [Firmicutes bacterium]|nr:hypothetical protein [Bacillota bacterium]